MTNTTQFDVAAAALQHLELLNHSTQSPLEIAAQFRTLLRSKKNNKNTETSNINYTYADYIAADATIRRRGRSHSHFENRSRSLSKIQYYLNDEQSLPDSSSSSDLLKYQNQESIIDDVHADSAIGSDSSDRTNDKIDFSSSFHQSKLIDSLKTTRRSPSTCQYQYPTINWRQLREKQYEQRLDKVKQFFTAKLKTNRISRAETTDLTTVSSLSNTSDRTDSCTYSNIFELQREPNSTCCVRSRTASSSSTSIRTPSISPINSPRSTYTISRLNSTIINQNDDAIFFPIADCNLIIKQQPVDSNKTISRPRNSCDERELVCPSKKGTIYV